MPIFKMAPADVNEIVTRMMEKYHPELSDAGVTIDCLFAHSKLDKNDDPIGPPVMLNGYPCAAVVKILGPKDRTAGRSDAEIVIDGDQWDMWSEDEADALIDHELTHLELATDSKGAVKRDDLNRPCLKMRKHDHQFGWFDSVARRHAAASFEVRQWSQFQEKHQQLWLSFTDEEAVEA